MDERNAVIVEPGGQATASVVWLHGLGADGHDFEPVVPALGAGLTATTRFVFPHAPMRPVTINAGYVMRAWYDIADADLRTRPDEAGLRESAAILERYVEAEEARGIPTGKIVLAGFSQGGAVALHTGLALPRRVAGVLALSTYLPLPEAARAEMAEASRALPVFMAHGEHDPVIPRTVGAASRDLLRDLGCEVSWHEYPMPHAVCPEEIVDIAVWLSGVLG